MAYLLERSLCQATMSDDVDDVRRVLTMAFRGLDHINRFDLERWLAFDMEWMQPHEAEEAVSALVDASWLGEEASGVSLKVNLGDVDVPLGWFPRPSRLLSPVKAVDAVNERNRAPNDSPPVQSIAPGPPKDRAREGASPPAPSTADPRAKVTARMKRFIARSSGLKAVELQRRADRKLKVFHHITPWLALALVAREQGLDMAEIVEALAVV